MADTPTHGRRKGVPPLVWIVVALLALLVVIAVVQSDGMTRSADSAVTMPVDVADAPVMPNPEPDAPVRPAPQ
jgi:hypothetical protein